MLTCSEAAPLIARRADGAELEATIAARLDDHLAECAACGEQLSVQRIVRDTLRMRPDDKVSAAFAARLSERLDEASGFFGMADWRAWTYRLAPLAAALALVAVLFAGQSAAPINLEEWTVGSDDTTSRASMLWNSETTPDSVIETMLIGEAQAGGGTTDVR